MSPTPNHGYNTPSQGTQDWDQPLNTNFGDLDADIEIRDAGTPSSNNYDPTDGAKYLDTDTGIIYEGDGNGWTEVFVVAAFDPNVNEASFDAHLSGSSITTGSSYQYTGSGMVTTTSVDGSDNDVWEVAKPIEAERQLLVKDTGEVTVPGDLTAEGETRMSGTVNRPLGVELSRQNDQSIPDGTETRVEYDDVLHDDRDEWDNNAYEFVAANDGTYRLDLGIRFDEAMAQGTEYIVRVYLDDLYEGRAHNATPPQGGEVSALSVQFTKTLWSVAEGDAIHVTVELLGDSNTIAVDYDETWLDIVHLST